MDPHCVQAGNISAPVWDFGRKLMEGKADTLGKSDLMEVVV